MPRPKDSKAKYFHARFNPATSEEEARALEIIEDLIGQGYNFKEIALDAILKAGGAKPEMFGSGRDNVKLLTHFEDMLAKFADELMQRLGDRSVNPLPDNDSDEPEQPTSRFARQFAKGFLQRQQKGDE